MKNVKKTFTVIVAAVLLALVLSACGTSSSAKQAMATSEAAPAAAPAAMEMRADEFGYADYNSVDGSYYAEEPAEALPEAEEGSSTSTDVNSNTGRKLIKNVNMSMETLTFDDTIAMIEQKAAELGGYVESSSVNNGSAYDYYYSSSSVSYRRMRNASYTVRIPAERLDTFTDAVGDMGSVKSKNLSTNDVTLAYVDTESRVKALRIQQDRLLTLLSEADEIESIIELERRLSDVNYELERNESVIRNYDNLVAFSTIYIDITEVERITHEPTAPKTVGERISEGLSDTFYDLGEGFKNFTVNFIVNLPRIIVGLVIFAIIVFVVVKLIIVIKRRIRKSSSGDRAAKPKKERKTRKPLFRRKKADKEEESSEISEKDAGEEDK